MRCLLCQCRARVISAAAASQPALSTRRALAAHRGVACSATSLAKIAEALAVLAQWHGGGVVCDSQYFYNHKKG